ncbi:hypothetical protein BKA83DRAFT_4127725 [Pisolithus microcarpus]|nr:hypothetical protein BKA83DRAFT_4127725 [Pisolithus microcarpus]
MGLQLWVLFLLTKLLIPQWLGPPSQAVATLDGHSLFDMELAREHGFEVTLSTNDQGHPITYCDGSKYHFGCSHISFPKKWVKVVGVPSPDEVAWFAVASIDPSLVNHTLTSSSDDLRSLEISIHNFKLEFPIGTSVKVIAGLDCGFQGMGSDQQVEVLGIFLAFMLHYYSSCELLVTPSMIQLNSTADLGEKGKSKAEEPNVTRGDSDVHEDSDLIQISVCMDDAIVIPPNTLQFSKERGYNVTVGDCVGVACGPAVGVEGPVHTVDTIAGHLTVLSEDGPWHDVPIGFCIKLQDYSFRDIECQVIHKPWIISGPSKGYRGILWSLKHTAVITEIKAILPGHTNWLKCSTA